MRLTWLVLLICGVMITFVVAWDAEDHEIFDLVSSLEAAEGAKTNFYSFMNVTPTATIGDIAKAYRKRSLELHPDRGGDQERFAKLGVISGILRDAEKRKRYDYFYEHGVPRWRGTGYYYSRYRPGLGSVLVFLSILSVVVQYAMQHLARYAEIQRIRRFQDRAKEVAWGSLTAPSNKPSTKRVKVALGENQNHSIAMSVSSDGTVSIMNDQGQAEPLDESVARQASWSSTWLPKLASGAYGRVMSKPATIAALPDSTALGDVDARTSNARAGGESDAAGSGANTPTPADTEQVANRQAKRQQTKESKKKR